MAIIAIGTYAFEEVTGEGVAIGVVGCALSIVVAWGGLRVSVK